MSKICNCDEGQEEHEHCKDCDCILKCNESENYCCWCEERRSMEVTVYMEHGSCAVKIAKFIDEETYMVCVPALEALAKKYNSTISESMEEE